MKRFIPFIVLVAVMAGSAMAAVDLVTVPTREGTQLTIYNSEDITMVREHRLLTVKKGINRIQFTWANTLIDPTSIEFRILANADKVDLVDTTFPSGRNDALQWNIESKMAGKLPVEIRYFTSGITWKADYVGMANEEETELNLKGYVRIYNNSGELYDNAQTRLVVGKINLVEKISDLATRPAPGYWKSKPEGREVMRENFRTGIAKTMPGRAMPSATGTPAPDPEPTPEIVKEGLSEYFLFTIGGREDIKNNEPKRLVSMDIASVPLKVIYKMSDRTGASQFTKYYRFKNEKLLDDDGQKKKLPGMENLGVSPLPDGQVRLFSEYKNKDLAYVGGTQTKYVPIGDRLEVPLGPSSDITAARRLKDQSIANVAARQYMRRLDNYYVEYYDLVDYDETFEYEEEIVSGKAVDIKTEIERRFDAKVILWSGPVPPKGWTSNETGAYVDLHDIPGRVERVDDQHVKFFLDLEPGEKKVVKYRVTYKRRKVGPKLNIVKKRQPI